MYKYGKGQEIINLAFESDSKLLLNSFFSMISSMDKSSIAMLVTPAAGDWLMKMWMTLILRRGAWFFWYSLKDILKSMLFGYTMDP